MLVTMSDLYNIPRIDYSHDGRGQVLLCGEWTVRSLVQVHKILRQKLMAIPAETAWVLEKTTVIDSYGATLLWHAWHAQWPRHLQATTSQEQVLRRCAETAVAMIPQHSPGRDWLGLFAVLGNLGFAFCAHVQEMFLLLGRLVLECLLVARHPSLFPFKEVSANVFKAGAAAMPVTALVGFLIGVVLSYLSALQLKAFGADIFIINILGIGIIRELGPILVAVLVAGRSGSSMTAQLGVMRVTEEIDALAAMGVSGILRLVFPKVLGLLLVMPFLVVWTSAIALSGGMVAAWFQLDLEFSLFLNTLARVVPVANLYIALIKGMTFGIVIALVACHFGLKVRPNTESLSVNTTTSVVCAITLVILVDAIFAILTKNIGIG